MITLKFPADALIQWHLVEEQVDVNMTSIIALSARRETSSSNPI